MANVQMRWAVGISILDLEVSDLYLARVKIPGAGLKSPLTGIV